MWKSSTPSDGNHRISTTTQRRSFINFRPFLGAKYFIIEERFVIRLRMIRGSYINKRKFYYLISNYDVFTVMDNSHHLGSNIRNTEAPFSVAERDAVIIKSFIPTLLACEQILFGGDRIPVKLGYDSILDLHHPFPCRRQAGRPAFFGTAFTSIFPSTEAARCNFIVYAESSSSVRSVAANRARISAVVNPSSSSLPSESFTIFPRIELASFCYALHSSFSSAVHCTGRYRQSLEFRDFYRCPI